MTSNLLRPPPARNRETAGFTLLELLVVVAIVAVISGAAALGIGAIGQDAPKQQAQRLALVWDSVCEEAAVDARVLGLQLAGASYQAVQPARDQIWRATPGALYAAHALPNGYRLRIDGLAADKQPSEQYSPEPQVLCLPGGDNPPVVLLLEVGGQTRFRIGFDPESRKHLLTAVALP